MVEATDCIKQQFVDITASMDTNKSERMQKNYALASTVDGDRN
jgi:hypothetical protein